MIAISSLRNQSAHFEQGDMEPTLDRTFLEQIKWT